MAQTLKDLYLQEIQKNYEEALDLVYSKVEDYATDADPFWNFRRAAEFAKVTVEQGILVRIGDKFSRYVNLLEKNSIEGAVGEKRDDTLRDAMNYTNILLVWDQIHRPTSNSPAQNTTETPVETPVTSPNWFKKHFNLK